ncbi:diguanylate cyclase [Brevibacillus sp. SYSU BS000544]|uniref:GGDEF domain-containing response regulator n=1 Tax=Brevibacillus sp. SYSU BS000544 TaxID=3416443 RepID=UPI003CE4F32D
MTKQKKLMIEAKKRFLLELSTKLTELHSLIESMPLMDSDLLLKKADAIYRITHSLKGSAPIFGFPEIGQVAEEMVTLWEWSQEKEAEPPIDLKNIVTSSRSFFQQLKIEQEIYQTEQKIDENETGNEQKYLSLSQFRLLVIDDDDVLRSFLVKRLQLEGYQVDEASDVKTAKWLLRENSYQLIVLDLMMYPETGYQLFDFLKEDPTLKWIPLIVLSGREDSKDKIRCFHLGADDYVTKPFHYIELEARIYSLLTRQKQYEELAFRDALTGVYNRRYFDHELNMECKRTERSQSTLSLAFIDIDRFKSVNDTYGHHIGDLALQGLGYAISKRIRSTDLLARYGGEEFVILFPATSAEQAAQIIDSVLQQIRLTPIVLHDGLELFVTFSAGVAEWNPEMSVESLVRLADEAMYQAKRQGRNRVLISQLIEELEETVADNRPKKVLVADDDELIRSFLIAKLTDLSLEVIEAGDGETAYRVLMQEPIDLCILDGVMPDLDGFSLLERIKADSSLSKLKVLMLSGRKKEEDVIRGLRLGADDYMAKPFSLIELELRVKRLLEIS